MFFSTNDANVLKKIKLNNFVINICFFSFLNLFCDVLYYHVFILFVQQCSAVIEEFC